MTSEIVRDDALLGELRVLIERARERVAVSVNRELVLLYWDLGQRVRVEILGEERATYGEQIVSTLSAQLKSEFGDGFGKRNVFRMIKFAETFPDRATVEKLSATLSWSHFVEILVLREPIEREFYATLCHASRWSVRGLRREIAGALFTCTALSRQTEELMRQELAQLRDEDKWTPQLVFRDPYLLSFLELADTYSERDLEGALLREMEAFLLELGQGFAFVARQKRMVIDGRDFTLDLLFYHRGLRRLVALDLKIGAFEAGFKGQMELYLRWLDPTSARAVKKRRLVSSCARKSEPNNWNCCKSGKPMFTSPNMSRAICRPNCSSAKSKQRNVAAWRKSPHDTTMRQSSTRMKKVSYEI